MTIDRVNLLGEDLGKEAGGCFKVLLFFRGCL
jgi:hypothetical protein